MNDKEFRLLHCQYCADPEQITRKELYSLIDYLHKENNQYLETIEDISKRQDNDHDNDCDCDNCCEDNEFKIIMNKEDLD